MKRMLLPTGLVLFALGIAAVLHPTFTYHTQEHVANVGPFHASIDEQKTWEVPVAATVSLLVGGLVLSVAGVHTKA
jgi:hypothetical protein